MLLRELFFLCVSFIPLFSNLIEHQIPHVGSWLANDEPFICYLFSLMKHRETFDDAVGLVEEVFAARDELFDLSQIGKLFILLLLFFPSSSLSPIIAHLDSLMLSFSTRQLAYFCRILALAIFEPERYMEDAGFFFFFTFVLIL
jgi:hypothetical protein